MVVSYETKNLGKKQKNTVPRENTIHPQMIKSLPTETIEASDLHQTWLTPTNMQIL